jgi:hypothetical protein
MTLEKWAMKIESGFLKDKLENYQMAGQSE